MRLGSGPGRRHPSGIGQQGHKAEVHVKLLVAVQEGEAGIVGQELDFSFLVATEHDDIFEDASGGDPGNADKFEAVAMQMDGVDVIALVAEVKAVTLPFF